MELKDVKCKTTGDTITIKAHRFNAEIHEVIVDKPKKVELAVEVEAPVAKKKVVKKKPAKK